MNNILKLFYAVMFFAILSTACNGNKINCDCSVEKAVCITILNETGEPIKSITLKHEKGLLEAGRLDNNSQTCVAFESSGENSFQLIATLSNGDTIKSLNNYAEGGYKITGTISKDSIKIDTQLY